MAELQLDPETIAIIQNKVASGLYASADAVVRTGLKALEEQDRDVLAFRESLLVAEAQFARGEGILLTSERLEEIKRRGKAKAKAGYQASGDVRP